MSNLINVYCDESCHLEHDNCNVMALGCMWCPAEEVRKINVDLREIKVQHQLGPEFETKWVKVSPGKVQYYLDVVDYFFCNEDLHFRTLVVPDKTILDHERHHQTHDDFYYKMYFDMLKTIINPDDRYRIYLDIKDTHGGLKIKKLHEVLCNDLYDFPHEIIERIQIVRSSEIEILQLCDLFLGAISAVSRNVTTSPAKIKVIEYIRQRSGYKLNRTTLLREMKFNLFFWLPKEDD